jgi:hypothetical protein
MHRTPRWYAPRPVKLTDGPLTRNVRASDRFTPYHVAERGFRRRSGKRIAKVADTPESDWVARFADEVIAAADRYRPGKPVVCASGLSPSGPVHLGNLREVLTPHLVADEIRRRGVPLSAGRSR